MKREERDRTRDNFGYMIPLPGQRWAHLSLPRDLTAADAERLSGCIAALVIPPTPSSEES